MHEALFVLWEPLGTKGSAGGKTSRSHMEIVQWSGSWTAVWINTSLFDVMGMTKLNTVFGGTGEFSEYCPKPWYIIYVA